MLKQIKNWMLPIAMTTGALLHPWVSHLSFLTPYLIFAMLLLSFSKISWKEIRLHPAHVWLLIIQLGGSIGIYALLHPFNETIAQGALLCVLAPTATAAVVITSMLGGKTGFLTAYMLFCNIAVALATPIYFSMIGANPSQPFLESVAHITRQVVPLLILPLFLATFFRKALPSIHQTLVRASQLTFYLWSVALTLVTGVTVQFILNQGTAHLPLTLALAGTACVICCLQFVVGRKIGRAYGDPISAGQGLGQKNTILALWMAQTYLHPLVSIAPASYILWQNLINSYQLWQKNRTTK